jgi:hypothetical protein
MTWDFLQSVIAGGVGGLVVKALDFGAARLLRKSEENDAARALLERHKDPILKTADELVGKIRSLAETDFADFRHDPSRSEIEIAEVRRLGTFYHFAHFWARAPLLQVESNSVAIRSDRAGKRLLAFLYELESKNIRMVDRSWQSTIGDKMLVITDSHMRPMLLAEFIERYRKDGEFQGWLAPVAAILDNTKRAENRQRVLLFGTVLHALIDTLDSEHVVTRKREPWANKLSHKSRRELEEVLKFHLGFIADVARYIRQK